MAAHLVAPFLLLSDLSEPWCQGHRVSTWPRRQVNALLSGGETDADDGDFHGRTALHLAASNGHLATARRLVLGATPWVGPACVPGRHACRLHGLHAVRRLMLCSLRSSNLHASHLFMHVHVAHFNALCLTCCAMRLRGRQTVTK